MDRLSPLDIALLAVGAADARRNSLDDAEVELVAGHLGYSDAAVYLFLNTADRRRSSDLLARRRRQRDTPFRRS
jgi:hypothetical protein